jgi:hypothetical protein
MREVNHPHELRGPLAEVITFFDWSATVILVWLNLIPEDNAQLSVFQCPHDENLTLLLQFLDRLWGFFPRLLERSDRKADTLFR